MTISIDQQIKCLEREIARRKKVFPALIKQGVIREDTATSEIAILSQALQTLTQIKGIAK